MTHSNKTWLLALSIIKSYPFFFLKKEHFLLFFSSSSCASLLRYGFGLSHFTVHDDYKNANLGSKVASIKVVTLHCNEGL